MQFLKGQILHSSSNLDENIIFSPLLTATHQKKKKTLLEDLEGDFSEQFNHWGKKKKKTCWKCC